MDANAENVNTAPQSGGTSGPAVAAETPEERLERLRKEAAEQKKLADQATGKVAELNQSIERLAREVSDRKRLIEEIAAQKKRFEEEKLPDFAEQKLAMSEAGVESESKGKAQKIRDAVGAFDKQTEAMKQALPALEKASREASEKVKTYEAALAQAKKNFETYSKLTTVVGAEVDRLKAFKPKISAAEDVDIIGMYLYSHLLTTELKSFSFPTSQEIESLLDQLTAKVDAGVKDLQTSKDTDLAARNAYEKAKGEYEKRVKQRLELLLEVAHKA